MHESGSTGKQLTAFLTFDKNVTFKTNEVRTFLLERLPEYMIPTYFMILENFPLNSNGKVDRKALPSFIEVQKNLREDQEYIAPKSDTEKKLVELWQKIFEIDQIGVFDDFFELGGHSLLVAKMAAEAQEHWGIDVKLTTVFQNRNIASLAEAIDSENENCYENEIDADELWDLV